MTVLNITTCIHNMSVMSRKLEMILCRPMVTHLEFLKIRVNNFGYAIWEGAAYC